MEFGTEKGVRDFLGLCLDPGHGREKRTPLQLTKIMPEPLLQALGRYAPHLVELRKAAEFREEQGRLARQMYADGLAAWIRGDEPGPAILNTPVPDLEALLLQVGEAFAAANAHIAECGTCRRDMRLPEMCADGQRLAVAAAATITEAVPAPAAPVVPAPEPVDRRLCPQNLVGDKAEPGEHFFKAAALSGEPPRCVYCGSRMTEPPAYRTRDGRLWTYASVQPRTGQPLYENATAPVRCDSTDLRDIYGGEVFEVWPTDAKPKTVQDCAGVGERGHGLTGKTVHVGCCEPSSGDGGAAERAAEEAAAPTWVFNTRSVNRTTKHALNPDRPSVTLCPREWSASNPIPAEEAARLALCGGCRRALTSDTED
ncbi:hypothetical protein ACIQMV_19405 [Streptomyces sp. NPDC091412]|uniref:hypothetical protein n=1 Tax=Streptomyces sp. NPDC091412 TaxID=3366002 RepID=UPI00381B0C26